MLIDSINLYVNDGEGRKREEGGPLEVHICYMVPGLLGERRLAKKSGRSLKLSLDSGAEGKFQCFSGRSRSVTGHVIGTLITRLGCGLRIRARAGQAGNEATLTCW